MKLTKEIANPRCLSYNIRNPAVFSLSTRMRKGVLAFGGSRQEVITKKNTLSRSRSARSQTTCPVSIRVVRISKGMEMRLGNRGGGGGGGVVGGVGVVFGDGVDTGVRGEEVVTCKLYLGLAFTILTLERVTIGCCEVGGGGVVGGVGVVFGDGVDSGVRGVDCEIKARVSAMIVRVPKKDRWCGTRVGAGDLRTLKLDQKSANNGYGSPFVKISARLRIQDVSATTFVTPQYSALALECEKVSWRLEDHVRRLSPRKTHYPEVDRRVARQPVQSASE
nr:hypothetical protein [Tanacetum cinerariifolium]